METAQITKDIEQELGTEASFSPYRLAAVASKMVGHEVRPQLTYAYCRQGLIKARKNTLGHWEVSRADATAWLLKYVPKHVA